MNKHSSYLDMVFWMPWRCGLPEAFSDLAAAAGDPEPLPAPLPATFKEGEADPPPADDGPGSPATDSPCPTEDMALTLSLGRVLVEPME